ncbi:MAG TPA: hypothetical protein VKE51_19600 [Vicinamibacterales bacterium]|nr:hypothetical protein [Vicinamibacterales bacterium]
MVPTFVGIAIYAAVAAVIGLLVLRYARWKPQPTADIETAADQAARGSGCSVALLIVVLIVVAALAYSWGLVAGHR